MCVCYQIMLVGLATSKLIINQVVMPVGSTIVFPLAFVDQNYIFFLFLTQSPSKNHFKVPPAKSY